MGERVVCLVQARLGSARLPGKSLRVLQGRPMIAHVLERAAAIKGVDAVVLATSDHDRDDALATYARGIRYTVYRGPHDNVLDRMFLAATLAQAGTIIRITGDCPFLDPEIAEFALRIYADNSRFRPLYVWNDTAHSGYPDGTDVEVFGYQALADAALHATSDGDREHVTPWIRAHVGVWTARSPEDYSSIKLSVDTPDDLARARAIAAVLPPRDYSLSATLSAYRRIGAAQ